MSESDCGPVAELLSQYLDRELEPTACDELEQHLKGCPKCIEFLRDLRKSVELCRRYGGELKNPPVDARVMAELRQAYEAMLERRRQSSQQE